MVQIMSDGECEDLATVRGKFLARSKIPAGCNSAGMRISPTDGLPGEHSR